MSVYLGIDPSLRSTGIVAINECNDIVFKKLIIVPSVHKDEENIIMMGEEIAQQVSLILETNDILAFGYERLAFNAPSGVKDKISGSYWYNRICLKELCSLYESFPFPPEMVSPGSWRKSVVTKEDRKEAKEAGIKIDLKEKALTKLPPSVKIDIINFIEEYGLKHAHAYDLCDAYWIARYVKENYVGN